MAPVGFDHKVVAFQLDREDRALALADSEQNLFVAAGSVFTRMSHAVGDNVECHRPEDGDGGSDHDECAQWYGIPDCTII